MFFFAVGRKVFEVSSLQKMVSWQERTRYKLSSTKGPQSSFYGKAWVFAPFESNCGDCFLDVSRHLGDVLRVLKSPRSLRNGWSRTAWIVQPSLSTCILCGETSTFLKRTTRTYPPGNGHIFPSPAGFFLRTRIFRTSLSVGYVIVFRNVPESTRKLTWNLKNRPKWKGKSSEPNLHFGVQNVRFEGCTRIHQKWVITTSPTRQLQDLVASIDSITEEELQTLRKVIVPRLWRSRKCLGFSKKMGTHMW